MKKYFLFSFVLCAVTLIVSCGDDATPEDNLTSGSNVFVGIWQQNIWEDGKILLFDDGNSVSNIKVKDDGNGVSYSTFSGTGSWAFNPQTSTLTLSAGDNSVYWSVLLSNEKEWVGVYSYVSYGNTYEFKDQYKKITDNNVYLRYAIVGDWVEKKSNKNVNISTDAIIDFQFIGTIKDSSIIFQEDSDKNDYSAPVILRCYNSANRYAGEIPATLTLKNPYSFSKRELVIKLNDSERNLYDTYTFVVKK